MAGVLMQISSKNKLKANHNFYHWSAKFSGIDANIFKEQTESKSQLSFESRIPISYWCKYLQRTNWKQITTPRGNGTKALILMQISSKNKLKANHNGRATSKPLRSIDANIFKEQTESKSQLSGWHCKRITYWCKYLQRTNWKQITTNRTSLNPKFELMQISSKNKLKANHNLKVVGTPPAIIDANIFKEQTESKSQLDNSTFIFKVNWCKYLQRTNWKQITTWKFTHCQG